MAGETTISLESAAFAGVRVARGGATGGAHNRPEPLRLRLLGRFRAERAGRPVPESAWERAACY